MAKVPLGKLARAMRLVSSGMGSSGWACRDILILLQLFMKHFLMTFFLYSTLFSFPCPLVRTKFPSRVIDRAHSRFIGPEWMFLYPNYCVKSHCRPHQSRHRSCI